MSVHRNYYQPYEDFNPQSGFRRNTPMQLLGFKYHNRRFYRGKIVSPIFHPEDRIDSFSQYLPPQIQDDGSVASRVSLRRGRGDIITYPEPVMTLIYPEPIVIPVVGKTSQKKKKRRKRRQKLPSVPVEMYCNHCKKNFTAKATTRAYFNHYLVNHACSGKKRTQYVVGVKHRKCRDDCTREVGCISFVGEPPPMPTYYEIYPDEEGVEPEYADVWN